MTPKREEEEEEGLNSGTVWAAREYQDTPATWDVRLEDNRVLIAFHMPDDDDPNDPLSSIRCSVSIHLDAEQALHLAEWLRLNAHMVVLDRRTREDYEK